MATELSPVEGLQWATTHVMSGATVYAGLAFGVTVGAGSVTSLSVLSGLPEENGTGYARQAVALGAALQGIMALPPVTWNPGVNTNWHSTVSLAFIASAASGGVAIFVWDLIGGPFNMSAANTNMVIPGLNYFYENPGGI